MEKFVVFLPVILFFGFIALVIFGTLALMGKLVKNAKDSSWQGEVIDKNCVEREDFDTDKKELYYSFKVKMDNGEIHNVATSPSFYNEVNIGDRLGKEKGAMWPKKL